MRAERATVMEKPKRLGVKRAAILLDGTGALWPDAWDLPSVSGCQRLYIAGTM